MLSANVFLCLILFQLSYIHSASKKDVCCELTGCFNKKPPFNHLPFPKCTDPKENTPTYNLYNRENSGTPISITPSNFPENLIGTKRTCFIAHGWKSRGDVEWVTKMKDELLKKEDITVVVIDWGKLAENTEYHQAASNTRTAGAHTALVMKKIRETNEKAYLWCIGHGLGAHLCAHAGATKIKVDRITGMDPSGTKFGTNLDVTVGLHNKSAEFVDVIHTTHNLGTIRPLGHLDFYPNGLFSQPGCKAKACRHSMAYQYFIKSIKQDCFLSFKKCTDHKDIPNNSCVVCDGCAVMGYGAMESNVTSGIMYLTTQKDEPFCLSPPTPNEICCKLTGCFKGDAPFHWLSLPLCTDTMDITPTLKLYSKANPEESQPITHLELPSRFSVSKRTYFIVHGWKSDGTASWVINMKDELLKKEDINVVVVNWELYSKNNLYNYVISNIRTVGAYVALVMKKIRQSEGKAYLWCIGHSLGAHLCAHAGAKIGVNRITGMDPAGPLIEWADDLSIGLNKNSAHFVDVMHTNTRLLGTLRPLGHLDFYPNGGYTQPWCIIDKCSHSKAYEFFIESIKQDCFVAKKKCFDHTDFPNSCEECDGCAVMGYGAGQSKEKSGIMYLTTPYFGSYCVSS